MGDDRPSVYFDGEVDRWVYRASSLGQCERRLVAARRDHVGAPTPDWLQVRFDEGHEWEDTLLNHYEIDHAREVVGRQGVIEIPVGKHAMVRGSLDGWDQEARLVVDAKFLGPDLYNKIRRHGLAAMSEYLWQMASYAHGREATGIVLAMGLKKIVGKGEDRKVVGVEEMHYLHVDVADLPTLAQVKARVMRLERMAAAEGWPACPDPADYPCPFEHLHDERKGPEFTQVADGKIAAKIRRAHSLNSRAQRADREAKQLKAEAKELLTGVLAELELSDGEVHRLAAGAAQVTWCVEERKEQTIKAHTRKYARYSVGEATDG